MLLLITMLGTRTKKPGLYTCHKLSPIPFPAAHELMLFYLTPLTKLNIVLSKTKRKQKLYRFFCRLPPILLVRPGFFRSGLPLLYQDPGFTSTPMATSSRGKNDGRG